MRYFYHYAASRPLPGVGYSLHAGTLDCGWLIDSSERYQEAMKGIADHIGVEADGFVVTSLTLLNPRITAHLGAEQ